MFTQLALIFVLNAVSNCLGTLKTVFISKQISTPAYVTTFIDAMVFAYAFKMVASSNSLSYILVFALGKLVGGMLGNYIEERLAFGLLEITVYKHANERSALLADRLRAEGFSVTTSVGYGVRGQQRMVLNIVAKRKDYSYLKSILSEENEKINMVIKDVNKAVGKVGMLSIPRAPGAQ